MSVERSDGVGSKTCSCCEGGAAPSAGRAALGSPELYGQIPEETAQHTVHPCQLPHGTSDRLDTGSIVSVKMHQAL